jgi:hypothetical protein
MSARNADNGSGLMVPGHVDVTPLVMLSPNATNLVTDSRGTRVTVTAKLHEALRCSLSRTVQVTLVDPTGNADPVGGRHVVVTGAAPPLTTGEGYVTVTGFASRACTTGGVGQLIVGSGVDGFVGLLQAAETTMSTHANSEAGRPAPLRRQIR